jgi:HEAT repeat protein
MGMAVRVAVMLAAAGVAGLSVGCKGGGGTGRPAQAAGPAAGSSLNAVDRSRAREAAIGVLLELTQSEDPQVRANAIEGLLAAPARLETVLPGALADPNAGVRAVAAMAVGKARMGGLVEAVRPLAKEESPFVKAAALFALRRCGDGANPTALGAMVTGDPSARVRAHAAYLLGELGEKGTSAMLREAAQLQVTRANAAEMKVLGVQIAEALVKLGDESQIHTIRAALYPATAEELDATVLAAQVLGGLQDRASEGQLRNLASMQDPAGRSMPLEVRLAVVGALGSMGASAPIDEAVGLLGGGPEPAQIQAAWALGQVGSAGAVAALEAALAAGPGATPERVRVATASGLLRATGSR